MTFRGYDVDFLWRGDVRVEQERMMDWLEARGEDIVACFVTHGADNSNGTGSVTVSSIERVSELARDLGVTVVSAKYIEEEWEEEEPVTA